MNVEQLKTKIARQLRISAEDANKRLEIELGAARSCAPTEQRAIAESW